MIFDSVRPLYDLDHECESVKLLPITVGGQKIGPCVKNPGTSPGNTDPIVPKFPT